MAFWPRYANGHATRTATLRERPDNQTTFNQTTLANRPRDRVQPNNLQPDNLQPNHLGQ
ncbi:MAG: hypothetical protein F6K50_43795 [Moorea sp. SIO3I7]|uniref:hypothetical protein n=1 Tax=Moorena sp. SIO3I8 TaxID=2607833 RepID=UPI0013C060C2|nr:hypothetical protein [Moorena sp. SIO3I8]NEO02058.1 hypothetical protein [Moorena sp. SIO3I7]NEO04708.1 hypothetical protein [Moorena sp. SIO3I8]